MSSVAPPGFRGSETSSAEVTVYSRGGGPMVFSGRAQQKSVASMTGRKRSDPEHSLVAVSTNKNLGAASGTFNFTVKPARGEEKATESLFDQIIDDDWVDIVLTRHSRRWHAMRGLVDEVRRMESVSGAGATGVSYLVTGRDFGKVFEQTPLWFNPFSRENLEGGLVLKVFTEGGNISGLSPKETVRAILFGFLEELGDLGRSNWALPDSMPNIEASGFIKNILFDADGYRDDPEKQSLSFNFLMPSGNAWSFAKEWSDPMFTELFTELYPVGGGPLNLEQGGTYTEDETIMTVVFRDKPFPVVDSELSPNRSDSPWFDLPLFIIPRQDIIPTDIGRSGHERYNAFFVAPQLTQETLGPAGIELLAPLWDDEDIQRHGLRRLDVMSKYTAPNADLVTLSKKDRLRVRDWYMANPYLLNGTIQLARGYPEIRVGTRVRIPGASSETDETYYVEQIGHTWQLQSGLRTTLGVTRGWTGTDDELINALDDLASRYKVAERAEPEASEGA